MLLLLREMRRTLQRWQQELHWTQQRLPRCILFSLVVHHPWIHLRFFTINDTIRKKKTAQTSINFRELKCFHESLWVLIIPLICRSFPLGYRLDQIWNWRRRRRHVTHFIWLYLFWLDLRPTTISEPIYES